MQPALISTQRPGHACQPWEHATAVVALLFQVLMSAPHQLVSTRASSRKRAALFSAPQIKTRLLGGTTGNGKISAASASLRSQTPRRGRKRMTNLAAQSIVT